MKELVDCKEHIQSEKMTLRRSCVHFGKLFLSFFKNLSKLNFFFYHVVLVSAKQQQWKPISNGGYVCLMSVCRLPFQGRTALEKVMATHSSFLAWKILQTEKPGRLQSMGSQESDKT